MTRLAFILIALAGCTKGGCNNASRAAREVARQSGIAEGEIRCVHVGGADLWWCQAGGVDYTCDLDHVCVLGRPPGAAP